MKLILGTIIHRIANETLSEIDRKKLLSWLNEDQENKDILEKELKKYFTSQSAKNKKGFEKFASANFNVANNVRRKKRKFVTASFAIAASVCALFGVSFLINGNLNSSKESVSLTSIDGLVLISEDGSKINLDEVNDTQLSLGNTIVSKTSDVLKYNSKLSDNQPIKKNTLYIPHGRMFKLELADGTLVHLNSGSKLTYPTRFVDGEERKVTLEGEAYFEVVSDKKSPFIVTTNQIRTRVFGTKFNVNAYADNKSQSVSLLEGSVGVSVNKGIALKMIKPNEQYAWSTVSDTYKIMAVDANDYIGWIYGEIKFQNENFETILKRLERKYAVKVDCNNIKLLDKKFTGSFKNEGLEQILEVINVTTPFKYNYNKTSNQLTIY